MRRLLLSLILLLAWSQSAFASCATTAVGTFTCKQSKSCANASGTNTCALASQTASNVLVGGVAWLSTTITLTSVSGCGAAWTIVENPTTGTGSRSAMIYGTGGSGACTVTITLSANAANFIAVHEILGADTVTPVSTRHLGAVCNSCATTTGAITVGPVTAAGTDYVFGFAADFNNADATGFTAGTGYTKREGLGNLNGGGATEDKSASGGNTVTFTALQTFENVTQGILSVAAGGGGGGCTAPPNQLQMVGVGNCKGQ